MPYVVLFAMTVFIYALAHVGVHDDSDPLGGYSGLVIYADARTGCQYLSTGWGFTLTPRMAADGKQLCEAK